MTPTKHQLEMIAKYKAAFNRYGAALVAYEDNRTEENANKCRKAYDEMQIALHAGLAAMQI